eukprot:15070100-Alexandrium_andersonii.AAC.1
MLDKPVKRNTVAKSTVHGATPSCVGAQLHASPDPLANANSSALNPARRAAADHQIALGPGA